MDNEYVQVRNVAASPWFVASMRTLYAGSKALSFSDRSSVVLDMAMELGGLEGHEHPEIQGTLIFYPHGTKRKRPAFIAVHEGFRLEYNKATATYNGGTFCVEVTEAGHYGVAGSSEAVGVRTEAEGQALHE